MQFYVERVERITGHEAFTGPMHSANLAAQDARAWDNTGEWTATVLPATSDVTARARANARQRRARKGQA